MHLKHFIFFKKYHIIFTFFYIFAFSLLLSGLYQFCRFQENAFATNVNETPQQIQSNIAKNIVRFHVIAHSDSDADQKLKLAVRDEVITSLQNSLRDAKTTAQASEIIMAHKSQIEEAAYRVLSRYNSPYSVNVSLEERYFPIKQYGDLVFPAGNYQALCIEIGKAEGRNWWCVLFPSLCFVDETTATVPKSSKEKLENSLSAEEYKALLIDEEAEATSPSPSAANPDTSIEDSRPEIHFGIAEWFESHIALE